MGAQNTSNQTAFMGDVHDLARLVAAALLPELRALAQVDPPMSIRDLAEGRQPGFLLSNVGK